jgi:FMN phosphatase YigB (HAD superfamily)
MIGDREDADILPAKAAGIATVRLLKGKHSQIPTKADYMIDGIGDLLTIMKNF